MCVWCYFFNHCHVQVTYNMPFSSESCLSNRSGWFSWTVLVMESGQVAESGYTGHIDRVFAGLLRLLSNSGLITSSSRECTLSEKLVTSHKSVCCVHVRERMERKGTCENLCESVCVRITSAHVRGWLSSYFPSSDTSLGRERAIGRERVREWLTECERAQNSSEIGHFCGLI